MPIVEAIVVQSKILSNIMITILCSLLVFQSYIQPLGTTSASATTISTKLPTVAKMLVDKAIQEFQSNNINNAVTYLQGAEHELSSSLTITGNNSNNNGASTSMVEPLTILLLVKNSIQALNSGDYEKGQKYLNLAEQELGRKIIDVLSSLNPQTTISTSNATYNNSDSNNGFFSTYNNAKYGIKLQYPKFWVIEANDYATGAAGQAGIQIASFYLPDVNNGLPFFRIGTDDLGKEFQNLQKVSINQYLNRSLVHKNSTGFPGFSLIQSDTNTRRLANNSAYTIVWTYTHPTYGMRKSIEIATILNGRGYFVDYTAGAANYSNFLPVAEKMIESFQKTK
ncbi:MAG TPA: hypothetical protein VJ729_13985 [Nitrososphaeraceae archaeon]|nr:hypothetical protein [Nitrososphaeraceae archaeon]